MDTYLIFNNKEERHLPKFQKDDIRYTLSFAEYFIKKYTKPLNKILDPFAGLGTSLIAAENLNRLGYGVELDPDRFTYTKSILGAKSTIVNGNSINLTEFGFPEMDFSISSPPYMNKLDNSNPLMIHKDNGDYNQYLSDLKEIYLKVSQTMKPNTYILIEVANLIIDDIMTPLAWDICKAISKVLNFKKEIIICWEGRDKGNGKYGYGYDHSYCLLFQNKII